jgi:poly(3-hydroxybutyrate) depolymerase
MRLRALLLVAACALAPAGGEAAGTRQVEGFGPDPGDLLMFEHVPDRLPAGAPLVVALHGCGQKAALFDDESGWAGLADRLGFVLLLPQQQAANNPDLCFNFFEEGDNRRGRGEAASIAAMIAAARRRHGSDPQRVYVTGLSAGGAMAAVMLAAYPELFAGGAILAGLPYGCADTAGDPPLSPWPAWRRLLTFWYGEAGWAAWACGIAGPAGLPTPRGRTPEAWAALARAAAGAPRPAGPGSRSGTAPRTGGSIPAPWTSWPSSGRRCTASTGRRWTSRRRRPGPTATAPTGTRGARCGSRPSWSRACRTRFRSTPARARSGAARRAATSTMRACAQPGASCASGASRPRPADGAGTIAGSGVFY